MADYKDDTTIWPIMTDLLGCVVSELEDRGIPTPSRQQIVPGDTVVLDLCEDCNGTVWVRLVTAIPTLIFPLQDSEPSKSWKSALAYTLEVGVSHDLDSTMITEDGDSPEDSAIIETARLSLATMTAIRVAICKCLSAAKREFLLGTFTADGPEGGAIDNSWTVQVKG